MDAAALVGQRGDRLTRVPRRDRRGETETLLYLSFEDGQRVCLLLSASPAPTPTSMDAEETRRAERARSQLGGGESSAAHA